MLVGILPTLLLGHDRLRTGDGLVLVGLTFMAVTAVRFLLVAGPIGAAIVCLVLAPIISASRFGRSGSRTLARLGRTRRGTAAILTTGLTIAVVVAGIGLAALRIAPAAQANAVAETYPVDAVSWLEDNRPGERIFNRYEWGGYLGLRLPDRPIFIDGRADVYDDEILLEYVDTISVVGDPQETFDRYGIDHILYPADSTLGRWLERQRRLGGRLRGRGRFGLGLALTGLAGRQRSAQQQREVRRQQPRKGRELEHDVQHPSVPALGVAIGEQAGDGGADDPGDVAGESQAPALVEGDGGIRIGLVVVEELRPAMEPG